VIDARSIVPFDFEPVLESVRKTGKILLTSDACERGSILQTFASVITRLAFDWLDAPPVVVGARNWITPPDEIEDSFFPFASDLIDVIHLNLRPLAGYSPCRPRTGEDLMRCSREGI
ncbi:MAG TPA: transketolase C-terminal domain-containing protein, partial [Chthonomonadales bacterium]|nr:transketolase C-terminal domain-containing protein [Chthonomonadales bacterium]